MEITDYFLNQGWIYFKGVNIPKSSFLSKLKLIKEPNNFSFSEANEIIINEFNTPLFILISHENDILLIGKYYFLDLESILSFVRQNIIYSIEINCFCLDIWSDFYFLLKADNNKITKYLFYQDGKESSLGDITKEEDVRKSNEKANLILDLSEKWIFNFNFLETLLSKNNFKVDIVKSSIKR